MSEFTVGDKVTLTEAGLKAWVTDLGHEYAPETWGVGTVRHLHPDGFTVLVDFPNANPIAQAIPVKFGYPEGMNMYTHEITKEA